MKKYVLTAILFASFLVAGIAVASNTAAPPPATAAPATATVKTKNITKGYIYAHPDAEYSVTLPEAPTAETLWSGDKTKPIPFLDVQPKYGSTGEIAKFKRVDADTGDMFDITITFVKADRDFLLSMTRERMEDTVALDYENDKLDNQKIIYSSGTDTLKWATLTGFSIDEDNNLFYNVAHYIAGLESVMMIKVKYNVENKTYQQYYDDIAASIRFTGK